MRRYAALLLSFIVAIAGTLLTAYAAGAAPAALQYTSVTCSSQYSSAYQCSYAVDGDTGTEWASNGEGTSAWIQFDLSGGAVQRLRYYGRAVDCWYWPYLEFDDGTIIDLPGGNGGCNGWHDYVLPEPITGKQWVKVHLEAAGGNNNSGFKEVELYDTGTFVEDADNLAYLSQVVPCSQHHVHTYNARRSIDFDDATTWAPAATDTDQPFWIEYTFPWQQTVGSVAILGRYTGDATGFGIPRLRLSSGLVITGSEYISSNHWITIPLPVATGAISVEVASLTTWSSWPVVHRPGIQSIRILSSGSGIPTNTWGVGGWIYYPLESYSDLGFYKTYSQTSQYGLPYVPYNIWKSTPGAMAYSIAQLEIVDVGQNFLGYYVKARINAWPDVPSTTIRYEGLSSVEVSPGELVGAQCPIGRVANRWEFGPDTYHLLLGVWFPDEETPFNPASWMTRRPTAGACQVAPPGGGEPAPGGPGPGGLWEPVCRDCPRPGLADLFNIGKWVDWLGCTISNLILCWLVRLINTVIAWVMWLGQTAVAAMGWITSQLNGILDWLGSAWNNLRTGLTNIANSAIRVVMESDLVQFIWAGIELARQAMGQVWELVLGLWSLMESAWTAFTNVTGLLFDVVDAVRSAFAETKVDIFDFFGVATGTGGQATGLVPDGGGGYGTMAEALAADGPNTEKAFYILTLAIGTADAVIGDTGLLIFTYILMAAIGWSVITWTLKQLQDILVW